MTETFNENVLIDGSADDAQLRVQGHTSQTEPLQTWEDSSGDVLAQVTGDGRLQVGDDVGLASPDALVEAHRAEGSTSKPKRAFHALGRVSNALDSIAQWIVEELEVHGSDSLSALQTALRVRAANMNTGTPSTGAELRGADIEVSNDAMAGSATLPKATGLQVNVTNAAGKTIDEAVGLHVKLDNAGTINTPYAIYTEGEGAAHFDDYLEVKRPTTVPGTPGTDHVRIYPKDDGKLYAKNWNGVESQVGGASFDAQSANTVFSGPTSGGAASPAFRALVANDIPGLDASKIASGLLDNARVNWGAPGAIGTTAPATVTGTQLRVLPASGGGTVLIDGAVETVRSIYFRTGMTNRWIIFTNIEPETGGNAGSNFYIGRYADNGAWLGAALTITRANGYALFGGNVAVSTSNNPQVIINGPSAQNRSVALCTNSAPRWIMGANTAAESGGGAGSNFFIDRYSDAGAFVQTVLSVNRGNGNITIGSNLGIGVASPTWSLELANNSAAKPGGGSWASTSDKRVKRKLTAYTHGLNFLRELPPPVSFEYNGKANTPEGLQSTGFVAQDLQPIAPSWVQSTKTKLAGEEKETDLLYVDNSDLVYVLMNSVLELADRMERVEAAS